MLRVLADNAFRDEYALDMPNDYMSYGGISRGVALESLPDCYIRSLHVTPLQADGADYLANVEVVCENLSEHPQRAGLRIKLAGTELKGEEKELPPLSKQRAEAREAGAAFAEEVSMTPEKADGEAAAEATSAGLSSAVTVWHFSGVRIRSVREWTPEHPQLYMAQAVLTQNGEAVDDLIDRVGFRTVTVSGDRILLNGRPLRIKGFCRHEDHPLYGCALPAEAMAHDLMLVKDMGANSIRTSHYPNDEIFLDLCDELGILVWEENHARGIEEEKMRNPRFEPQCEQVIREMITRHYNHPSIYIWGILNECASDTEYGRACYQAQYELIRRLDSSRPCTSASCKFNQDICQDLEDVCSWNIYPYWYDERSASQMAQDVIGWAEQNGAGGKPFLISEIGAGAIYGFRDASRDIWSEELQAEILEKQLRELSAMERCSGLYIWQFCDMRVARQEWAIRRPKSRNNKGVVDEYRRPKLSYAVVREIFSSLPDYWV